MDAGGWATVPELLRAVGDDQKVSVAVTRLSDGAHWAVDGDRAVVAASTVKVPILVAAMRAVDRGDVRLDDRRTPAPEDRVVGTGVLSWLDPEVRLRIADYAYLMIALSDNTASNVMIDVAGMDRIRETIAVLGMVGTRMERRFLGRMPTPAEGQNWTTANDLVRALVAVWNDTAASPSSCAQMRQWLGLQQDRAMIGRVARDGLTFSGKSGSLPLLAHDCGVISGPRDAVAIAILTEGFADPYDAFDVGRDIAAAVADGAGLFD